MIDSEKVKNYTDATHLIEKAQKRERVKTLFKIYLGLLLLVVLFMISSLTFYLYRSNHPYDKIVGKRLLAQKGQVLSAVVPVLPVRLSIPQINLATDIEYVGVTAEGAMDVPSNIANAGWFRHGPLPGGKGSAVISGHVDGKNNDSGVFANLYKLKKGDTLFITDGMGKSTTFVVRESRMYDPGYADEVFSGSNGSHLNLITCDGVWDGDKKSYTKRLVVFTDILP